MLIWYERFFMYKRLFRFMLVVVLLLSTQDHGFCSRHSTLRKDEFEKTDYVRYPLITKNEEIDLGRVIN